MGSFTTFSLLLVLLLITVQECKSSNCQEVTTPMCSDIIRYPALMPNMFGHTTQEEANIELHQYYPFLKIGCSSYLKPFLCSAFFSPCTSKGTRKLPCRSLCENTMAGCLEVATRFGFIVPEALNCERFPEQTSTSYCIQPESFGLSPIKT
ncbi:frizzled-2-like [Ciona intestinalis]